MKAKVIEFLTNKKIISVFLLGMVFWFGVTKYLSSNYTVGINVTPSLPYRFIVIHKGFHDNQLVKNKIIGFSFGFDSKYDHYKKGTLFAKRIMCMPGDQLTTIGRVHYCNDEPLYDSALKIDSKGKPVTEFFDFNGTVPKDKYYVKGDHTHSYDSRYWGFIDKSQIIGVMSCGL